MNVIHMPKRNRSSPVRISFGEEKHPTFPKDVDAAFAAIVDHLRIAATIAASQTDSEFGQIMDFAHRLDQTTDDDMAVDLLVTLVDWENEEREFGR